MSAPKIVMATGGTGGHIYPALAVGELLRSRGYSVVILGQQGGMEAQLAAEAGFEFRGVSAGKFDRHRPDPRQAWRAFVGLSEARRIVKALAPQLVVGFGGFASFPGVAAAAWLRLPVVLHEQNAYPGLVTRWFARRATVVAVSDRAVAAHLPAGVRVAYVGYPIREVRLPRAEARARLGLPEAGPVTLVMGGSQGSQALNTLVPSAYRRLPHPPIVLHSSGPSWEADVRRAVADLPHYHVAPYLDAPTAWSAADLAITRAGFGTLAEAAYHGVPLVMVPLPGAAEDHQHHNAVAVERAGAGLVVRQDDAEREIGVLAAAWQALLDDAWRQQAAACAAKRSPEGAAAALAGLIEQCATRSSPALATWEQI
jgi:UDP-N-acetylglucosamine--N-acetylmuramyl-(pentapeptide) pyrophosphoryl-undecaprenol N-acetylglucosamine transferase